MDLTVADQVKAKEILLSWQYTKVPAGNLIDTTRTIIHYDYLFILFYVILLIKLSHDWMNRESWYPLNVLLRLNLPIIVLAGLFDIIENGILLYNLNQWPSLNYVRTTWFTFPKFLLAGWVLLVWVVAMIKMSIQKFI